MYQCKQCSAMVTELVAFEELAYPQRILHHWFIKTQRNTRKTHESTD